MTIWLFRHAKSSWQDAGLSDFDRPLNARGQRDGPRMASWLKRQSEPAEWLWSSDAKRALATAEYVRSGFSLTDTRQHSAHELYLASPETMLGVLQRTPADINSVGLVAHNPGTTYLLNLLIGEQFIENVPTFGAAKLDYDGDWSSLTFGSARLALFSAPKLIDQD